MSEGNPGRSQRRPSDSAKFAPPRMHSPPRFSTDKSPRRKAGIRVPICPAFKAQGRCDNESCELFHDKAFAEGEAETKPLDVKAPPRVSKLQRIDDNSAKISRTPLHSDDTDRRRKSVTQVATRVVQNKFEGDGEERVGRSRDARVIELNGFDGNMSLQVRANLTRSASRDLHLQSRSHSFSRSRSYSADSDKKRRRELHKSGSGPRRVGLSDSKISRSKPYKRKPNSPSPSPSSRSRSGSRSSSFSHSRSLSRSRSRSMSRTPPRGLDPKFASSQYNKPLFRPKNNFQQPSSFSRPLSPRSRNSFSHASPSRHSQDSPRRGRSRDNSLGRGNSSDRSPDSGSPGRGEYQTRVGGPRGPRLPQHRSGSKLPLHRSSQRGRPDARGDDSRRRFGWNDNRQGTNQGRALRTRDLREGRSNTAPGFNQDRGSQGSYQRRPNFSGREHGRGGRFREWSSNAPPDKRSSGQDFNARPPFRRDGQQGPYRERMAFNSTRMSRGGFRRDNNSRFSFGSSRFSRDDPSRDSLRVEGRVNQPSVEKPDSSQEKPPESQQPKRFYTPKNSFALIQVCDSLVGEHLMQEVAAMGVADDNLVLFPTLVDFASDYAVFANLNAQKSLSNLKMTEEQ